MIKHARPFIHIEPALSMKQCPCDADGLVWHIEHRVGGEIASKRIDTAGCVAVSDVAQGVFQSAQRNFKFLCQLFWRLCRNHGSPLFCIDKIRKTPPQTQQSFIKKDVANALSLRNDACGLF